MIIFQYFINIIYYLFFGLILVVFHILQFVCLNLFGYQAHKKSVDLFNWFLVNNLRLLGTRFHISGKRDFEKNKPYIIIANHQSMYDIPPIIWHLRKLHPKFISKKELGKGIPGISYNLRNGGSVLIDRDDPGQAEQAVRQMGQYIKKHKRSVVIFPEGTRSRDGIPKRFAKGGLRYLLEECPEAMILPVSIKNAWQLHKKGMFPLNIGVNYYMKIHQPLKATDHSFDELHHQLEKTIHQSCHDHRSTSKPVT
ncbi:MAG: lysophospholipid acyltransferase family protein [Psychroflexus sp.]|nr:lysophospholipid acyltransferase family protein [Psychroflexus sp.]MDR9449404.1 lysophospholipid acyltransferase family protein [Psychroflexus sp.]